METIIHDHYLLNSAITEVAVDDNNHIKLIKLRMWDGSLREWILEPGSINREDLYIEVYECK